MQEIELTSWVSDNLTSLMGYSEPNFVQYVLRLSTEASSPSDLVRHLADVGLSSSTETSAFAEEIFKKVPRQSPGSNLYREQEKTAILFAQKQRGYKLIEEDSAEEEIKGDNGSEDDNGRALRRKSRQEYFKKWEKRKREEMGEGIEHARYVFDEITLTEVENREKYAEVNDEDDGVVSDSEAENRVKRQSHRTSNDMDNHNVGTLRRKSRQEYLEKREKRKLEEMRDDLEDEHYLFDGITRTEKESREHRYKRQVYELVKKGSGEGDDCLGEYQIPEAYDREGGMNQERRFAVAMEKYRDSSREEKNPFAEQVAWEDHQINKGTLIFGSRNRKLERQALERLLRYLNIFMRLGTRIEGRLGAPSHGELLP